MQSKHFFIPVALFTLFLFSSPITAYNEEDGYTSLGDISSNHAYRTIRASSYECTGKSFNNQEDDPRIGYYWLQYDGNISKDSLSCGSGCYPVRAMVPMAGRYVLGRFDNASNEALIPYSKQEHKINNFEFLFIKDTFIAKWKPFQSGYCIPKGAVGPIDGSYIVRIKAPDGKGGYFAAKYHVEHQKAYWGLYGKEFETTEAKILVVEATIIQEAELVDIKYDWSKMEVVSQNIKTAEKVNLTNLSTRKQVIKHDSPYFTTESRNWEVESELPIGIPLTIKGGYPKIINGVQHGISEGTSILNYGTPSLVAVESRYNGEIEIGPSSNLVMTLDYTETTVRIPFRGKMVVAYGTYVEKKMVNGTYTGVYNSKVNSYNLVENPISMGLLEL